MSHGVTLCPDAIASGLGAKCQLRAWRLQRLCTRRLGSGSGKGQVMVIVEPKRDMDGWMDMCVARKRTGRGLEALLHGLDTLRSGN